DLGLGLADDINSAPGNDADQALLIKLRQCFSQRCAAYAELGGKLAFIETQLGIRVINIHIEDGCLQRLVCPSFKALGLSQRRDLELKIVHPSACSSESATGASAKGNWHREVWYTIHQRSRSEERRVGKECRSRIGLE